MAARERHARRRHARRDCRRSGLRIEAATTEAFPTALSPVDVRHPIFAAFGDAAGALGRARFLRAMRVVPGPNGRVVARFTNGLPALVDQPIGSGRIAVFASSLGSVSSGGADSTAWNTFARQATFVPFVHETLRYLAGPSAGACRRTCSSPTRRTSRAAGRASSAPAIRRGPWRSTSICARAARRG